MSEEFSRLLITIPLLVSLSVGFGLLFRNSLRRFRDEFSKKLFQNVREGVAGGGAAEAKPRFWIDLWSFPPVGWSSTGRLIRFEPTSRPIVERVPSAAFAVAVLWFTLSVVNRLLVSQDDSREVTLPGIQLSVLISLALSSLLWLALTDGGRRPARNYGIILHPVKRQISLGLCGFLAAIGPTGLLLITSSLWRTVETQHLYLKALRGEAGPELIWWILVSAVIAAPLTEELLFRVTVQGWLSDRLPAVAAIGITAAVFALVHGWRDALPLIPLSLILGRMFHQSRRYWACVIAHALFNATNIALTLLTQPGAMGE